MRVMDLRPGDVLDGGNLVKGRVVFIACVDPHPLYPGLWMVIWRMPDGEIMMDALSPLQELPQQWLMNSEQQLKRAIGIK